MTIKAPPEPSGGAFIQLNTSSPAAAPPSSRDATDNTRAVEREVLQLVASGRITVPIAATYSLDDATTAYDAFRGRGKLGKIVLLP
jgi:NADPH:quinone reductase